MMMKAYEHTPAMGRAYLHGNGTVAAMLWRNDGARRPYALHLSRGDCGGFVEFEARTMREARHYWERYCAPHGLALTDPNGARPRAEILTDCGARIVATLTDRGDYSGTVYSATGLRLYRCRVNPPRASRVSADSPAALSAAVRAVESFARADGAIN